MGEAVGDTLVEELDQFGSEAVVEARVAVEGLGGLVVVDETELLEGALEVDTGLEGDGPEEGDGVDLAVATDEAGLLGDPLEDVGGEQFEEGVLEEGGRRSASGAGCAIGGATDPVSAWWAGDELDVFEWKGVGGWRGLGGLSDNE